MRPLTDLFGDIVLDVDVKPNRGDVLSLVGLAREVAAVTGATVRFPETDAPETGDPIEQRLAVDVEEPELCPRFVARFVGGVTVGPSPDHVQMRLLAAGQRPVSNVVDVSNYVMLELGKPIHTFDAAAVHDGRIVVRLARDGERMETLDHVDRALDPDTLLIADPAGPLGIAGVMGGAASEVTDATTDVVVESAIFDPVSIRRTAFRYGLRSEASLRFEKGQEHRLARLGADRSARLIEAWAGGTVATGVIDTNPAELEPVYVPFRPARVDRLLGVEIPVKEQRELLARVGVITEPASGPTRVLVASGPQPLEVDATEAETVEAIVPPWRRDLVIEADVTEEVARVRGFELIPGILPHTPMPPYRPVTPAVPRCRPGDPGRGRGVGDRVVGPRVARDGRALSRRRRPARDRRRHRRRPAGSSHEPAVQPAFGHAPAPPRQPARGRGHEPSPGPRRHRDLRDRQGLRCQRRRRGDARVVAARIRADRPGRDPVLESPGPAV